MCVRLFFEGDVWPSEICMIYCLRFVCNRITSVFKGECSSYGFKFGNFYGSHGQTKTYRSCRRFIPRKHLGRMEGGHRATQQFYQNWKTARLPFTKRFQMLWEWTSGKKTLLSKGISWTLGKKRKQPTNFFSRRQQNLVTGCFCWSHFRQAWSHPPFLFLGHIFGILQCLVVWYFMTFPTRWAPKNQLQIPNGMK